MYVQLQQLKTKNFFTMMIELEMRQTDFSRKQLRYDSNP